MRAPAATARTGTAARRLGPRTGEALDDALDPDATSRAEVAEAPAKCMEVTLREAPSVMGWILGSIHALQRHRAGPLRDVTLTRQR